jgi:hypothetical protein
MRTPLWLAGQRYGSWTVIGKEPIKRTMPNGAKRCYWLCQCDCGREREINATSLKRGISRSCGCGIPRMEFHGMSKTAPEYKIWMAMRERCNNPNCIAYRHYGGSGVSVCKEWNSFSRFLEDMGNRPSGMTLDRINPYGNYEPCNCRWATWKTQANNKRRHWS